MESIVNRTVEHSLGYDIPGEKTSLHRVDVLCEREREILFGFSSLCLRRLNRFLPLRVILPLFQHFVDANVLKELEKSRLVITNAASAFFRGEDRSDIDVHALFEMTKEIDYDFAKKVSGPFLSLHIRHDDFSNIREKRISAYIMMVFDLFPNWQEAMTFADAVKSTYYERAYREIISEILHLYSVETRLLGNSITFHGPAGRVKDMFTSKLFFTMEKAAAETAESYTRKLFLDGGLEPL